jgi:hypothetical protein
MEVENRDRPSERDDGKFHMKAKFDGICAGCGSKIYKDTIILYKPEERAAWHPACGDLPKRGRIGFSPKTSRGAGLNGGGGSRNRRIR